MSLSRVVFVLLTSLLFLLAAPLNACAGRGGSGRLDAPTTHEHGSVPRTPCVEAAACPGPAIVAVVEQPDPGAPLPMPVLAGSEQAPTSPTRAPEVPPPR